MNSTDTYEKLFYQSLRIRLTEERIIDLYPSDKIQSPVHLSIGQEAVATGAISALNHDDYVIATYRDHAHALARESSPRELMAELYGRSTGVCKGKGGSMHMFSVERGFYGGHGIVGAQVPIGTGIAFAHKYRDENSVCLTFLGDGAINQGQVYESFNMASL